MQTLIKGAKLRWFIVHTLTNYDNPEYTHFVVDWFTEYFDFLSKFTNFSLRIGAKNEQLKRHVQFSYVTFAVFDVHFPRKNDAIWWHWIVCNSAYFTYTMCIQCEVFQQVDYAHHVVWALCITHKKIIRFHELWLFEPLKTSLCQIKRQK